MSRKLTGQDRDAYDVVNFIDARQWTFEQLRDIERALDRATKDYLTRSSSTTTSRKPPGNPGIIQSKPAHPRQSSPSGSLSSRSGKVSSQSADDFVKDWTCDDDVTSPDKYQSDAGGVKGYRPDKKAYQDDDFERNRNRGDELMDIIKGIC